MIKTCFINQHLSNSMFACFCNTFLKIVVNMNPAAPLVVGSGGDKRNKHQKLFYLQYIYYVKKIFMSNKLVLKLKSSIPGKVTIHRITASFIDFVVFFQLDRWQLFIIMLSGCSSYYTS